MSQLLTRESVKKRSNAKAKLAAVETVKGKLYYLDVAASLSLLGYGIFVQDLLWIGIGFISVGIALLKPAQWFERKIKQRMTK